MQSLIIKFTNTSAFRAYLKSRGLETKDNYLNGGMVGKSKNHWFRGSRICNLNPEYRILFWNNLLGANWADRAEV